MSTQETLEPEAQQPVAERHGEMKSPSIPLLQRGSKGDFYAFSMSLVVQSETWNVESSFFNLMLNIIGYSA